MDNDIIEREWEELSSGLEFESDDQREENRLSFFAGALAVLRQLAEAERDEDVQHVFESMCDEVSDHVANEVTEDPGECGTILN